VVVNDPASELVRLVTDAGDPPPAEAGEAARRRAELVRRRFGLALPPPFAPRPRAPITVRLAASLDAAAIAAIKWRCFGTNYRGLLADDFLDGRSIVPPVSFWVGRAMLPPSRRHRLFVWGPPGAVYGYADTGPAIDDGPIPEGGDPDADVGEVYELYVDPTAQGLGGGSALLDAAIEGFVSAGFERAELSVLSTNERAQAFYRSHGWEHTGRTMAVDLGVVAFEEHRFARPLRPAHS
jgi:ribosomal protein S18 acetylase RimI-like enzyme